MIVRITHVKFYIKFINNENVSIQQGKREVKVRNRYK